MPCCEVMLMMRPRVSPSGSCSSICCTARLEAWNMPVRLTATTASHSSALEWDAVVAVNLTGMFHASKRAVQQMLLQEPLGETRGRIINITSQHGMVAGPRDFAYGV